MSQYPPQYPQYPPPYTAPQGPPQSPDELLAPARRAGVTMIVMGVLAVLFGLAVAVAGAMCLTPELLQRPEFKQLRDQIDQIERDSGTSAQKMFVWTGAVPLAIGAVLGAMGFIVRAGNRGAITASMVVVSGTIVLLALAVLVTLVQGLSTGQGPQAVLGACFYSVPVVLLLVVMAWLIQAARAAPKVEWARQHYQSQLWQYQQHQQAYLQNAQQQPMNAPPPGQQSPQQPPPSGMGYHISTPPISPGASEKKDPPDAPPPQA